MLYIFCLDETHTVSTMTTSSTVWLNEGVTDQVKIWVNGFFTAADTKGSEAAGNFASHFLDDAKFFALTGLLEGRKG